MDFFDFLVHRDLQRQIDSNRRDSLIADNEVLELQARVRILEQTTAALWTLVKEKTGWTDEELIDKANALQERRVPGKCSACGRTVLVQNAKVCSWCGQPLSG